MPDMFDPRVISRDRLNDIVGSLRIIRSKLNGEGDRAAAGTLQHLTYSALAVAEKMWEENYASHRE